MSEPKKVKVILVASPIGQTKRQRDTLRGLGLRRVGSSALVQLNEPTLGMIRKVAHLVRVEDTDNGPE